MTIACAASLLEDWHDYINISMEMILTYSSLGFISYILFKSHFWCHFLCCFDGMVYPTTLTVNM